MKKTNNKENKFIEFWEKTKKSFNKFYDKIKESCEKVSNKWKAYFTIDENTSKAKRGFIKFCLGFKKFKNRMPEFNILLVMILLFIILSIVEPIFASWDNVTNLLCQSTITGVVAVGMTFIIVSAGIDLSVGSILALAGVTTAQFITMGMPIAVAILLSVLISVVLGFLAGLLIHKGPYTSIYRNIRYNGNRKRYSYACFRCPYNTCS